MSDATPAPAGRGDDEDPGSPPGAEPGSRGFFSRIMEALSPAEAEPGSAAAPARGAPSLSNLRRLRVEEVANPKSAIVAVPVTVTLPDLVEVFRTSGRTRLPVHAGSLDEPLGMVNLKDLALRHGFGASGAEFDLRGMLRPLLYVPPSMPLAALLTRMQAERIHMALIIDEFGGSDGLVTIEDLLETVVGEIDDEHDVDEPQSFTREADGVWIAEGATALEDIERAIGLDLTAHEEIDAEEVDTLGGLVFLLSGHVPQKGEVVRHPDGPLFEVLDADARRVRRLRVRMPPPDPR